MTCLYIWYDNIVRLDLIYKINVLNSYTVPNMKKITLNANSHFASYSQLNVLCLITIIILITNQKPIVTKTYKSLIFLKYQKFFFINSKSTIRKLKAFNFLNYFVLCSNKKVKLLNLNGLNSLSFKLNNLNSFPQLINRYNNITNFTFVLNLHFDLSNFLIFDLILSSLQIFYE